MMRTAGIVRPSVEDREIVKYVSCFWGTMGRELIVPKSMISH